MAENKNTSTIDKHTTTKPVIKHLSNEISNIEEASVVPCITELTCKLPSEYELPLPYHTSPSDAGGSVSLILNIHTHKKNNI